MSECEICGNDEFVSGHHIDGDDTNDDESNLLRCCARCHWSIHFGADGYEQWSDQLPNESRGDIQRAASTKQVPRRHYELESGSIALTGGDGVMELSEEYTFGHCEFVDMTSRDVSDKRVRITVERVDSEE